MPSLSIVIPTRNRPPLAQLAVETALAGSGADAEVVVSDNGDVPLALPADPRLRVLRGDRVLSMPDNWERGLRAARGEWIVFMGDKDRLVPGGLDAVARAGGGAPVVTYLKTAFKQDVESARTGDLDVLRQSPGVLERPAQPVGAVAVERDSRTGLREWYQTLFYCKHLPMLYNAMVHRALVERAWQRHGRFFHGSSPDIGASLMLLAETPRYIETTLPVVTMHFPTTRLADWSMGVASSAGSAAAKRQLVEEFASSPNAKYHLPLTFTAGIAQALLEFKSLRPELFVDLDLSWERLALLAAEEIEREGHGWRWHAKLLRATQSGSWRPRAAWWQAKAIAISHAPRLYQLLQALRGAAAAPAYQQTSLPSLSAALAVQSAECAAFSAIPARVAS